MNIVNTKDFNQEGSVQVDGMTWSVRLPGAKTERQMAKAQRKIEFLDKKKDPTEEDIQEQDDLEDYLFDKIKGFFKGNQKQINKWFDDTPMSIIIASFESIKKQSNDEPPIREVPDGSPKKTS